MKKLLLCLGLLLLTACIPVDNFGAYWDRGTADKALAGKWENAGKKGEHLLISVVVGSYRFDSRDEKERREKSYTSAFGRTLAAGNYTFFMAADRSDGVGSRSLVRYSLKGDVLTEYELSHKKMLAFLKKNFPKARNIHARVCKTKCLWDGVSISTLDSETVRILAAVPDNAAYWQVADRWRRVR